MISFKDLIWFTNKANIINIRVYKLDASKKKKYHGIGLLYDTYYTFLVSFFASSWVNNDRRKDWYTK